MTAGHPVTQLAQFPWPLILGGLLGLVLSLAAVRWGARRTASQGVVVHLAASLAGASAGAFAGLVWMWVYPMARSFACLYACREGMQFLSNEQFRQITLMADLAWVLPLIALVSGAVALWASRRDRRRPGGDQPA